MENFQSICTKVPASDDRDSPEIYVLVSMRASYPFRLPSVINLDHQTRPAFAGVFWRTVVTKSVKLGKRFLLTSSQQWAIAAMMDATNPDNDGPARSVFFFLGLSDKMERSLTQSDLRTVHAELLDITEEASGQMLTGGDVDAEVNFFKREEAENYLHALITEIELGIGGRDWKLLLSRKSVHLNEIIPAWPIFVFISSTAAAITSLTLLMLNRVRSSFYHIFELKQPKIETKWAYELSLPRNQDAVDFSCVFFLDELDLENKGRPDDI